LSSFFIVNTSLKILFCCLGSCLISVYIIAHLSRFVNRFRAKKLHKVLIRIPVKIVQFDNKSKNVSARPPPRRQKKILLAIRATIYPLERLLVLCGRYREGVYLSECPSRIRGYYLSRQRVWLNYRSFPNMTTLLSWFGHTRTRPELPKKEEYRRGSYIAHVGFLTPLQRRGLAFSGVALSFSVLLLYHISVDLSIGF
jgi:hypothetical protein